MQSTRRALASEHLSMLAPPCDHATLYWSRSRRVLMLCQSSDKKPSCRQGGPTVPLISEGQRPTSGREKKAISQSDYSPIDAMVMLLYRTLQSTIRHGNSTHTGDGCRQQFCTRYCSQTATDRDMYVTIDSLWETRHRFIHRYYRRLSMTYGLVNNTCIQTNKRQTNDTSCPKLNLTVSQKLFKTFQEKRALLENRMWSHLK